MTGKYDQIEGVPYGRCVDCGIELATDADGIAHRAATMGPSGQGPSHSTRAENAPRAQRIQQMVDHTVYDAIEEALDKLRDEIDRGDVTADEVREALRWHSDFGDAWGRE